MEGLHEKIQYLKDKAQEQFLEVERYYNAACLEIFEDESKTKIFAVQSVVQQFKGTFEKTLLEDDIRQAFKIEEALLELDTKLGNFVESGIEIGNYQQVVKNKYEALDLLEATQIAETMEKFKNKHLDIIFL